MDIVLSLLFPLLVALFLAVAALSCGVDSRPGFDERAENARFGALR